MPGRFIPDMQEHSPSRVARVFSGALALLWLGFGVYHLLHGQVASHVPSVGFLSTCALSLAAPFVYGRVQDWPRHGYTVLLVAATMFCVLLATLDVAMHYLVGG